MSALQITTRHANPTDIPLILSLLHEKAEFDRGMRSFDGRLQTTPERLQNTLFNSHPFAKVLFAEVSQTVCGLALYYFRYSSFAARPSLWLDDLYVQENCRGCGAGTILMTQLAEIAQAVDCTHIAWNASAYNDRGIRFYKKIGAEVIETQASSLLFQANESVINSLTQSL